MTVQEGLGIMLHVDKDETTIDTMGDNGINVEVYLIISEDEIAEDTKWLVENVKFSVKQPIEAVVTKEELEHLAELCRSEVDSMGRIAVEILHLLKLEESIGQAIIDQLSNHGSGGLDKILTPEKLSRQISDRNINYTPSSNVINESPKQSVESTVASLKLKLSIHRPNARP